MSTKNMKKMMVVGSSSYGTPMQHKYTYMERNSMYTMYPNELREKPDLVVFTGGEDINPNMYGEESISVYGDRYNDQRDHLEKTWYLYAKANKIPMVGICRGMQLFTIMQGGKLLQHIDGHGSRGSHPITTNEQKEVLVNSLHHQVCVPYRIKGKSINHVMLAWSHMGTSWKGTEETELLFVEMGCIPEAIWFPDVKALGVQFHPEMMQRDSQGYMYFQEIFSKYIG